MNAQQMFKRLVDFTFFKIHETSIRNVDSIFDNGKHQLNFLIHVSITISDIPEILY